MDVVYSQSGALRVGISKDAAGVHRLRAERWAAEWDLTGDAAWSPHDQLPRTGQECRPRADARRTSGSRSGAKRPATRRRNDGAAVKLDRLFAKVSIAQMQAIVRSVAGVATGGFDQREAARISDEIARLQPDQDVFLEPIVDALGGRMPFVLEACRRGDQIEATIITAPPLTGFLERELADLEPPPNVRVVRGT